MIKRLFVLLQYLLPQHRLSRLVGRLAQATQPWLKNPMIKAFIRHYSVDMNEASEPDSDAYSCFNDFFTRALKPGARPIDSSPSSLVCPADGSVSQLGEIVEGRIFQAKGQFYSCLELLGGDAALANSFAGGRFATIYLSPRDYHRVHMPCAGQLRTSIAVPGNLFSVNAVTTHQVPRLFARNERLITIFDTDRGSMAMVLVGAMIVAGIETVWGGQALPMSRRIQRLDYRPEARSINLAKGEEMGRFKLGSTVILLFPNNSVTWDPAFSADSRTRMGEVFGQLV
mgnify:CR=1 FL=1